MLNHYEKCIQISTNMPGTGSLIGELTIKMSEIWESKTDFRSVKPMSDFKVLSKLWNIVKCRAFLETKRFYIDDILRYCHKFVMGLSSAHTYHVDSVFNYILVLK